MSNYNTLKSAIQAAIKTNGNNEITGQILQDELLSMIAALGFGYQFMGIAFPNTYPGVLDAKVFYIAYQPGTYTYMGGIVVTGLCVLKYDTAWTKEDIQIAGGGSADFITEPDDLTLETGEETNLLKFANRTYNSNTPNGFGYKILRKNLSFSEQVTDPKTVYSIRYDFDLTGSSAVDLPDDVILRFDGGSIKNGTIAGSRTVIEAGDYKIFDNIVFSGTFVGELNACWVGAKAAYSTFDNSPIIQAWFGINGANGYSSAFKNLYFPYGTYYFLSGATLFKDVRDLVLDGNNSLFNVNIPTDDEYFIKLQATDDSSGEGFRIQNVRIKNTKKTSSKSISRTRAILFDRAQRFEVCNVQIWYFDVAITIIDVWYGGFSGQNAFRYNRVGLLIYTTTYVEVNTIECHNIDFKGVSRDVVAMIYPQNEGESDADYLTRTASCGVDAYCLLQGVCMRGCVYESFDYGIRTSWRRRSSVASQTGGPFSIIGCYFEGNRAEDIYVGRGNVDFRGSGTSIYYFIHELTISDCRFFTLKHVYLCGAKAFITSNQDFSLKVDTSANATTVVDYQGPITIDELVGPSATVHKIGGRPATLLTSGGSQSVPGTNFQRLQQTRFYGNIISRLDGYSKTSSSGNSDNVQFKAWNFETEPKTRFVFDIHPLEYYRDPDNSFNKLIVPSGNGVIPVAVGESYNFRALNTYGGISLFEFIRRWNAGTTYTGKVKSIFPFTITADPVAGTVVNEGGTLVGFGKNALGTTITTSYTTGYYLFIDAMVWVRISYSRIKQYCDHLQCGRLYSELRGSIDGASNVAAYLSCYGSAANMANVQKRLNAVYWDTTNSKLMIYTGFEWVEMTSPFQRYYYKAYGVKLAERATMADLPGQTFTNYATGITYTFAFRPNNNFKWVPSIGLVDDLAHPNGYADDNTLDYANELSVGEMVIYNGALYKWDGTQLVAV